jgi:hypothetical protein
MPTLQRHGEGSKTGKTVLYCGGCYARLTAALTAAQEENKGPDGFATWKDAAIAERVKRVSAVDAVTVLRRELT